MKYLILLACLIALNHPTDPPLPIEFTATEKATIALGSKWSSSYHSLSYPMVITFDGDSLTLVYNGDIYLKADVLTYRYSIRRGKQTHTLEISKDGFLQYIIIEAEQKDGMLVYGIMIPSRSYETGRFFSYKIYR